MFTCKSYNGKGCDPEQVAWGQLYVDRGDQKNLGPEDSGWLNIRAEAQPYGTGVLTGVFSPSGRVCLYNLPWGIEKTAWRPGDLQAFMLRVL